MQTEPKPTTEKPEDNQTPKVLRRQYRNLGLIGAFWAIIVVVAWFAIHRPFGVDALSIPASLEIAGAVGRTLADVLLLVAVLVASGAVGLRVLDLFPSNNTLNSLERALFAFGLGLGVEIFSVLLIGVLGGLNWPIMYGLLAALLLLNLRQAGWIVRGMGRLLQNIWHWFVAGVWWEKALGVYLGLTLLLPLLIGLGPVFSWDALMYHLAAPKLWVEAGRIQPIFEMPPASYPFGIEMLFTWGLVLRGDGLAQIMHWLFLPLGGAAIWAFAMHFFSSLSIQTRRRAALLSLTLYLSVPHLQLLASWPYTDLLIAFYAVLSLFALLLVFESKSKVGEAKSQVWGYVAISGICSGLAFSGKYTAVTVAIAVLAAGLYFGLATGRMNRVHFFSWAIIFGGAALATALPWLIRNWAFTGNPIAPIFWGVNGWHPDEIAPIVGKNAAQTPSLEMILGRPIRAAIFGTSGGPMDATITPLYLAFLPLTVWAAFRQKLIAALMLCVGIQYFIWIGVIISTSQLDHSRILVPTFPFLALATGYGLAVLPSLRVGMLKVFAPLLVGLFLLGNTLSMGLWFAASDTIPYMTGIQTRDGFLDSIIGSQLRAARYVNSLPADSYTFFFFEPRSYYFDRHVAPDLNGGEFFYFLDNHPTADKIEAELKRRKVTHVLVREKGLEFLQNNTNYVTKERANAATQLLNDFKTKYLKLTYEEKGQYSVYELR